MRQAELAAAPNPCAMHPRAPTERIFDTDNPKWVRLIKVGITDQSRYYGSK